jgi:hypothetical protein
LKNRDLLVPAYGEIFCHIHNGKQLNLYVL